ncbi:hypothetical protein V8C37DRAFT_397392 [Trichoderma ceciliae]
MSWICRNAEPDTNDRALLRFSQASSEAFSIWRDEKRCDVNLRIAGEHCTQPLCLEDEVQWENWLRQFDDASAKQLDDASGISSCPGDKESSSTGQITMVPSAINLVMSGRASSLSRIPFSEKIFTQMMRKMKIHRSVIRAINRNTSCTFSRMTCALGSQSSSPRSIVYTCRTAESWEDDMALSVTFLPNTLTTNAIWFGCNLKERDIHGHRLTDSAIITGKLRNFDGEVFHPMMLPTVFAEFERDRHANLVRESNTQFVQRMIDIESRNDAFYGIHQIHRRDTQQTREKDGPSPRANSFFNDMKGRVGSFLSGKTLSTSSSATFNSSDGSETLQSEGDFDIPEDTESCAMLWIKISHLKNGLANWKTQVLKMIEHIQELENTNFGMECATSIEAWNSKRDGLKECGKRIEERLRDLVDEYDDFIRECDHIMAGMSLATQLDLNNIGRKDARLNENISRSSLAVAETAQRDGSLMKSIAVLGMIYLPATFVCTFFSMGFFQWRGQSDNTTTVSPDVWIFALVAIAFTLLTIGVFLACTISRSNNIRAKLHLV